MADPSRAADHQHSLSLDRLLVARVPPRVYVPDLSPLVADVDARGHGRGALVCICRDEVPAMFSSVALARRLCCECLTDHVGTPRQTLADYQGPHCRRIIGTGERHVSITLVSLA